MHNVVCERLKQSPRHPRSTVWLTSFVRGGEGVIYRDLYTPPTSDVGSLTVDDTVNESAVVFTAVFRHLLSFIDADIHGGMETKTNTVN